jgi:CBS domain containing-hemolysin-like protein
MNVAAGVLAIVVLVAGNGFFVAAEFAYVAVDRNTLETAAESGDHSAQRALAVLRRLSFMLSGAQLGITATSLLVGFIAKPVSRSALDPVLDWIGLAEARRDVIAVVVGFLLVTGAQMVFAELVPKNLAIARPDRVARLTAQPVTIFMRLFSPVIRFFDAASNRLLRSVGIEPVEELSDVVSLDELDTIIAESTKEGSLDANQAGLLENVLSFRLLSANDIATHRPDVITLESSDSCLILRDRLASGHSRFPVLDAEGQVAGVVHGQALLTLPRSEWSTTTVAALMVSPVFAAEVASLTSVLRMLRDSGQEVIIVLDEYGSFSGLVSLEDLAEELVGDIVDESDADPLHADHPTERVWVVPGSWRLDEVYDETGISLPDGPYDTIAGLVLTCLERMASVGDIVRFERIILRVREVDRLRITQVAIETTRESENQ